LLASALVAATANAVSQVRDGPTSSAAAGSDVDLGLYSRSLIRNQGFVQGATSDTVTLASFAMAVPTGVNAPELEDVGAWSSYIELSDTIYGSKTFELSFLTGNTAPYDKKKAAHVERFFQTLQRHKDFYLLIEFMEDSNKPGFKILRFFALLRGDKTPEKVAVLNSCMLVFSMNLRMLKPKKKDGSAASADDPESLYQPNVTKFTFDCIFAALRANNIHIGRVDLKGCNRSYHAYWEILFSAAADNRDDFGRRPNKAAVEKEDEKKMREADPPLNVFLDPRDHLRIMFFKVDRDVEFRGKEVSTTCANAFLCPCCCSTLFSHHYIKEPLSTDYRFNIYR
jgi:hypothetical protein